MYQVFFMNLQHPFKKTKVFSGFLGPGTGGAKKGAWKARGGYKIYIIF